MASIGGERNKRNGKPNKATTALPMTWLTKPRTRTAQPDCLHISSESPVWLQILHRQSDRVDSTLSTTSMVSEMNPNHPPLFCTHIPLRSPVAPDDNISLLEIAMPTRW